MKKLLAITVFLSVSTCLLHAQNKTIKGKIIDDNLEILPGVSIMINDTVKVGNTDLNGFFKIDIPASLKKISLGFVGFEPTAIELADECNEVEIVMLSAAHYDFITPAAASVFRCRKPPGLWPTCKVINTQIQNICYFSNLLLCYPTSNHKIRLNPPHPAKHSCIIILYKNHT